MTLVGSTGHDDKLDRSNTGGIPLIASCEISAWGYVVSQELRYSISQVTGSIDNITPCMPVATTGELTVD